MIFKFKRIDIQAFYQTVKKQRIKPIVIFAEEPSQEVPFDQSVFEIMRRKIAFFNPGNAIPEQEDKIRLDKIICLPVGHHLYTGIIKYLGCNHRCLRYRTGPSYFTHRGPCEKVKLFTLVETQTFGVATYLPPNLSMITKFVKTKKYLVRCSTVWFFWNTEADSCQPIKVGL